MPQGRSLAAPQIALLKQWIDQGAPWPETAAGALHWSFVPPQRPLVPAVRDQAWVRNPVDAFILAELEKQGLRPSPEADRRTLLRRVTLDLTGLPPAPEEVEQFLADRSPDAYEKLVDRQLASPRYGERMARAWLDLVRYAESDGYRADFARPHAWRYRDYVVASFNADKGYDRFVREQLGEPHERFEHESGGDVGQDRIALVGRQARVQGHRDASRGDAAPHGGQQLDGVQRHHLWQHRGR